MCCLCAFEILTQICCMVISQKVILTTFIVLLLVAWTTFTKRAAHEFFRMFYLTWKLQFIGLDRQDDKKFWWVVNSQSVFTECVFSMWCLKNSMISGLISWQTTSWCFFCFVIVFIYISGSIILRAEALIGFVLSDLVIFSSVGAMLYLKCRCTSGT